MGLFGSMWASTLAIIYGRMNSELYQIILKENVRTVVSKERVVMQQDNDPKHSRHFTKKNQIYVFEWPSY